MLTSQPPSTDPYEAALSASTLVSMIPTHTHVQSVYTGSSTSSSSISPNSTVLAALKSSKLKKNEVEETTCIEQSTIRMDVSQQVGGEIEGTGAGWVDAPVSGGTFEGRLFGAEGRRRGVWWMKRRGKADFMT